MQIGASVVGVEGDRRLELAPGLWQPGLHLPDNPEGKVSRRLVRNTPPFKGFR